jgi:hypothetical protein
MGPWGFVQPNQLSQVAYGSSLSFIKDAILLLLLGSGIVFLLLAHTIADNARLKNHINYLLIVTIGPLFLGSATNFIMPYFQVTNAPFPLLSVGAIISAIVFSYAMSQHQILELRLVIKNSFLYSMLTAIISAAYLAVAQISTFMLTFILPKATILVSYLFVMATLLLAAPLRNKIQWFLDSYIFRDKYEYHHVLNETFAILSCMEERNRLLPALLSLIRKHFRARSIMLILPEDIPAVSIHGETGGYSTRTQTPLTLDAKIMEHFTHQLPTPKPLIINPGVSHISAKFQQLLDEVKLVSEISPAAIIPLYTDRVIGIMILDERDNNRLYGDSDLEILATISREMTTTLLRIRNSHSMANRKITGVTTEVASQRLSDLRNSLRVIQRVKEGFDKKTKREFLQEMISEEEKRLESSIRLLEKSSDKSPKK